VLASSLHYWFTPLDSHHESLERWQVPHQRLVRSDAEFPGRDRCDVNVPFVSAQCVRRCLTHNNLEETRRQARRFSVHDVVTVVSAVNACHRLQVTRSVEVYTS